MQPSMLRCVQKGQIGDGLPQKLSIDVALKSRQSGVSPTKTLK
jgi:hypothetical protein